MHMPVHVCVRVCIPHHARAFKGPTRGTEAKGSALLYGVPTYVLVPSMHAGMSSCMRVHMEKSPRGVAVLLRC